MSEVVAAIDCGTNTVRLLLASWADGLVEHGRQSRITRLGQGVDATGAFAPEALARTLAAIEGYAERIRAAGATKVRLVATSAARDARNRAAFAAGVRARLGVDPEVITGAEEAALSFAGAAAALPRVAEPRLVVDIGGGSTELAAGAGARLARADSLDMGSVRLRERLLRADPPARDQVDAATALVERLLDATPVPLAGTATLVGVGGTFTTLAALHLGLDRYDRDRISGARLAPGDLAALADVLLGLRVDELMARWPIVPRGRAEVLCGGALIAARVAARAGAAVTVCESDILDGVALGLLGRLPA